MTGKHGRATTPMIAFTGSSGAGKTAILEKLIRELNRRKVRLGAIKHTRGGFTIDRPGTDSSRFAKAGAKAILLVSPGKIGFLAAADPTLTPSVAMSFFPEADLILVEGWKDSSLPKIVFPRKGEPSIRATNVIAEIGTRGTMPHVPLFHPRDVKKLADFILSFSRAF